MNTLNSYTTTSPDNKTETCARFVIDNVTNPFIMSNVATIDRDYMFSFWIKSDSAGSISTCDMTIPTSTDWTYHTIMFTAESVDLVINFATVGTYYIYHSQLEIGNKATDWNPAPEDTDQNILDATDDVRKTMVEQNTSVIASCNDIILSALESYVEVSSYDAFKTTVEAQLSVMSDEIAMNFTTTTEQVNGVNDDMQSKFTELYKYISFSENGIIISAGVNQMSIRIDNDIVQFSKNGEIFGWWDGVDFHTGNIIVKLNERAQFGNFAFLPRSDGSLSFLKVSE